MVHVFEDNKRSMLSKFFELSYPPEEVANFHYTESHSKLVTYIEEHFKVEDKICVYLDLPPGNRYLRETYINLAELSADYQNMRVFPIVCREYYLLKHIQSTACVINRNWLDTCLSFGLQSQTTPNILAEEERPNKYTTFEGFCKLVAKRALAQCARVGIISAGESSGRPYYKEDCPCGTELEKSGCIARGLLGKSNDFVRKFPVFPNNSYIPDAVEVKWEDTAKLHRFLVTVHNLVSIKMSKYDEDPAHIYESINPII